MRRQGVGSILFKRLISEARWKGFDALRITTGAQNQAMRALANKFGAHLTFRHGESTGTIDLAQHPSAEPVWQPMAMPADALRAMLTANRAYWRLWLQLYGLGGVA